MTATDRRPGRTARATMENPFFSDSHPESETNPRTVDVVVNLRESSIVSLASHDVLDVDQVAAAFRFRRQWEELARLRRPANLFERIDTGGQQSIERAEREDEARRYLMRCRTLLGLHGFELLTKICGEGYHIRDLYPASRRDRDTATDMLRVHLTCLSRYWR